jgi:hypothetical protein
MLIVIGRSRSFRYGPWRSHIPFTSFNARRHAELRDEPTIVLFD